MGVGVEVGVVEVEVRATVVDSQATLPANVHRYYYYCGELSHPIRSNQRVELVERAVWWLSKSQNCNGTHGFFKSHSSTRQCNPWFLAILFWTTKL